MKLTLLLLGLGLASASIVNAQDAPPQMPPRAPEELDQLLAPIALYPDPLLGAMLPASTHPGEIAAAASFASANLDPAQIDLQPWDPSVKVVAHYPDVAQWMAQNADWTNQLGAAVLDQESDVLNAIQRLRANARAAGILVDTPQQQVVVVNDSLCVIPTQPDVVYVPYYDPGYIEQRRRSYAGVAVRFGAPIALGAWATFGLDWRSRSIAVDHEREEHRDWRRFESAPPATVRPWRPAAVPPRERVGITVQHPVNRPAPLTHQGGRWEQPTRTPGLAPTGRMYPTPEQHEVTTPEPRATASPPEVQKEHHRATPERREMTRPEAHPDATAAPGFTAPPRSYAALQPESTPRRERPSSRETPQAVPNGRPLSAPSVPPQPREAVPAGRAAEAVHPDAHSDPAATAPVPSHPPPPDNRGRHHGEDKDKENRGQPPGS